MKASYRTLSLAVPLGILLLSQGCADPPRSSAGPSGFVDAYFDASTLNTILAGASCTGVRFYNARRLSSDTKGTAIAIGIKSTGEEIYNGTTIKYKMFDAIGGGIARAVDLTRVQAVDKINFVKAAGEKSYAANFSKSQIESMLLAAGCNGIRLIPELSTGGNWSMRMHPVKIAGSGATVNPAPPSAICGEPCPSFCGSFPSYYIHLP